MSRTPVPLQGSSVFLLRVFCQPVSLSSMGPHGSLVSCCNQRSHHVGLSPCARACLDRLASAVLAVSESEISAAIAKSLFSEGGRSDLR